MAEKQPLGEILLEKLEAIDDVGGNERYQLRELIGKSAYDRLLSKERTANLVDRWVNASTKAKPAATNYSPFAQAGNAHPQGVRDCSLADICASC
jgi:hypothetical protein